MEQWFLANKLSVNLDKTCYTIFSKVTNLNVSVSLNLNIGKHKICQVPSCKYLGVIIDEKLNWKDHVDFIYKKLVKFTGIFYKIRDLLPRACLNKLYFSFVYCHLLYGIEVYANTSKSIIDRLVKLNNKLIRILFNKKRDTHSCELYKSLNILPIPKLHELQLLLFVHKCNYHKHLLPSVFHNYFVHSLSVHEYNTRRCKDFYVSSFSSTLGQRCSKFKCSKLWNNLPNYLKSEKSQLKFKQLLKIYFQG